VRHPLLAQGKIPHIFHSGSPKVKRKTEEKIENRLRQAFAPPSLLNDSLNPAACLRRVFEQLRHHGVYAERTPAGYRLLLAGFEETVA
jgi:hypothetical protein